MREIVNAVTVEENREKPGENQQEKDAEEEECLAVITGKPEISIMFTLITEMRIGNYERDEVHYGIPSDRQPADHIRIDPSREFNE